MRARAHTKARSAPVRALILPAREVQADWTDSLRALSPRDTYSRRGLSLSGNGCRVPVAGCLASIGRQRQSRSFAPKLNLSRCMSSSLAAFARLAQSSELQGFGDNIGRAEESALLPTSRDNRMDNRSTRHSWNDSARATPSSLHSYISPIASASGTCSLTLQPEPYCCAPPRTTACIVTGAGL